MTLKQIRRNICYISAFSLGLVITTNCYGATHSGPYASDWFETKQNKVRLISATRGISANNNVQLGLQFELKDNWKIYWRTPGDAGFPPRLDWGKSINLKNIRFDWPAPTRFKVLGLQTTGYKKEVIFPIVATVQNPKQPLRLRAELNYLTCDDICIPYKTNLALNLSPNTSGPTRYFNLIHKYVSKVPGDGSSQGLTIERVETAGEFKNAGKNIRKGVIRIIIKSSVPMINPDVFVEGPDLAFFSPPQFKLENDGKMAVVSIPVSEEEETRIDQSNLTFTIKDGARTATQTHTIKSGPPFKFPLSGPQISLPFILSLALLGGIILNLMPCVLPVISLKILTLILHGGAGSNSIRINFLAYSLGILFSFLVIATALVALKLTGSVVGWGIQFQQPWFIVGITTIVTLFAYNLWGLFELHLPSWISNIANKSTKAYDAHQTFRFNFGTGAFATILATPCSAPFLGTSVGFALAGSYTDIYMIFTALGLGMASPFILASFFPALANKLPKPGNWMNRVKHIMGAALAATSFWLILVLAVQVNNISAAIVGSLMVGLGVILFCKRYISEGWHKVTSISVLVFIFGSFVTPYYFNTRTFTGFYAGKSSHWIEFTPERISELVANGKTVFVDLTAEWCITCQVNKTLVLNRGKIFNVLSGGGEVVAMQGDWTKPNPTITAYLKRFGRYGIPFNAIYGPSAKNGIVLPELLTVGTVWEGLRKASGGSINSRN